MCRIRICVWMERYSIKIKRYFSYIKNGRLNSLAIFDHAPRKPVKSTCVCVCVHVFTLPSDTHTACICCSMIESLTLPYQASLAEFRSTIAEWENHKTLTHTHTHSNAQQICVCLCVYVLYQWTGASRSSSAWRPVRRVCERCGWSWGRPSASWPWCHACCPGWRRWRWGTTGCSSGCPPPWASRPAGRAYPGWRWATQTQGHGAQGVFTSSNMLRGVAAYGGSWLNQIDEMLLRNLVESLWLSSICTPVTLHKGTCVSSKL